MKNFRGTTSSKVIFERDTFIRLTKDAKETTFLEDLFH